MFTMVEAFDIDEVEEDPFADRNISVFYEQIKQTYDILHYTAYFTESIKLILSILSIVADTCIITIIIKNRQLKTNTNIYIYILHYSVWHIVAITIFPLFRELCHLLNIVHIFLIMLYYYCWKIYIASLSLIFLFGLCLAFDWFLNIHIRSPQFVKPSALFNKYAIYLIYIFAAVFNTIDQFVNTFGIIGFYILVVLPLSLFNFLDYSSKNKESNLKNYGLVLSNIIVFFWLPCFVYDKLLMWSFGSFTFHSIVLYTIFLSQWLSLSVSLVLIVALVRMDVDIKVAMLKIFNRRSGSSKDDVEILEDGENEDVPNRMGIDSNGV
uniref:Uncharacterized protein LOC114339990 isoform X1 n=2 Tax=Diabrotica virgifera virgifera TaxID=50390 RepID=A0A6P7GKJ2_DIAVI